MLQMSDWEVTDSTHQLAETLLNGKQKFNISHISSMIINNGYSPNMILKANDKACKNININNRTKTNVK